jgi:acyl-CoA synthetase (AMP-forming)/AMP-acid ligase II
VNGFRPKGVAAVGVPSQEQGTEEVHLLVEGRGMLPQEQSAVAEDIVSAVTEAFSVRLAGIHWLEKGGIPRATSGKVQRYRCRQMILAQRVAGGRLVARDLEAPTEHPAGASDTQSAKHDISNG